MPFSWAVALRFLKEGRLQSILIIGGASIGVSVMVFLTALIDGVQKDLIDKTLGTQAHIIVEALEDMPRKHNQSDGDTLYLTRVQQPEKRLKSIESWPKVLGKVRGAKGVVAAAPVVSGAGYAARGNATKTVKFNGVDGDSYNQIVPIRQRMTRGEFRVQSGDVVIGKELAKELGARPGDKIRLAAGQKDPVPFTVQGVFDVDNREVNLRWVFLSIRSAQSLLDLRGGVSTIQARVGEIFEATEISNDIVRRTGLASESWMDANKQLLVALRSQDSSSGMIQFFVVLAVAMGIASVLFVSVIQKSKEIGILKAMGTTTRKVTRVFMIQGFVVGFVGTLTGCLLGAAMAVMFRGLLVDGSGDPILPITLHPLMFLKAGTVAIASSIVASVFPARRAARLDPAAVIRNG